MTLLFPLVCISCKRWMDNYSLLRLQTICLVSRGDPQGEPTPHSGLLELGGYLYRGDPQGNILYLNIVSACVCTLELQSMESGVFCQLCMEVMLITVLLTTTIAEGQCLSGGLNNANILRLHAGGWILCVI